MVKETMKQLAEEFGSSLVPYRQGEVIEVEVKEIIKNKIFVDVAGVALGVIPSREFSTEVPELKVGDKVLAHVLSLENDEGNVVLSLKRADKERLFLTLEQVYKENRPISVRVTDANRGGLLCEYGKVEGFLPLSQLSFSHYPKGAKDSREILNKISRFIGQTLQVKILNFDKPSNKLIFSEKAAGDVLQQEKAEKLKMGQKCKGEIVGIVPFGIFINVDGLEGLVHISEVSWEKVDDLNKKFKTGQEIEVMVIGIDQAKVSFSIKRLKSDPWLKKVSKFKVKQKVEGKVSKLVPFGAFITLQEDVDGLVPVDKLGKNVSDPRSVLEEGKKYKFEILSIEPSNHKILLELVTTSSKKKS